MNAIPPDRATTVLSAFLTVADGRSVKDMNVSELFRRMTADVPDISVAEISAAGDMAKRAGGELHSLAWHLERALDAERRRRAGR